MLRFFVYAPLLTRLSAEKIVGLVIYISDVYDLPTEGIGKGFCPELGTDVYFRWKEVIHIHYDGVIYTEVDEEE